MHDARNDTSGKPEAACETACIALVLPGRHSFFWLVFCFGPWIYGYPIGFRRAELLRTGGLDWWAGREGFVSSPHRDLCRCVRGCIVEEVPRWWSDRHLPRSSHSTFFSPVPVADTDMWASWARYSGSTFAHSGLPLLEARVPFLSASGRLPGSGHRVRFWGGRGGGVG